MSDDANGKNTEIEDEAEKNEDEEMSKCKKIKISNNESEQAESSENVDTKSEISEAPKDAPESTDSVANSGDSSTNNSDNTSNESEKVESASSNVSECTDSNVDIPEDAPKQHSDNSSVELKQPSSVIEGDNKGNKFESSAANLLQNESSGDSVSATDNEKIATSQLISEDKNDESKTSTNSLKNGEETLYELLNNPTDVQDNANCNITEKTEASSNSNTEQTDVAVESESIPIEIKKNDDITCEELFEILQEKDKKKKKKVLIIDVRNEEEYCKSRMSFHDNLINIQAEKIQRNKVPGYYRYILMYDIEAEKKFSRRSHSDIIVLVDKNSEFENMNSDSPIAIFKNSLEEYDVHIDYKRIAVLRGGFEEWTKLYPDLVTKS